MTGLRSNRCRNARTAPSTPDLEQSRDLDHHTSSSPQLEESRNSHGGEMPSNYVAIIDKIDPFPRCTSVRMIATLQSQYND